MGSTGIKVKWLGHAFFALTTAEGRVILMDPWIEGNPTCPVKAEDINKADIITVSHDHFDHAGDAVTLAQKTGGLVIAQPETANRFKTALSLPENQVVNAGFGMNIGGTVEVQGISITMTQAFHSSETGSPCGYLVRLENGKTFYHAGDTGIFGTMKELGEIYPIDVALLPIGGCFTMDPIQAVKAVELLNPKIVIPMHFKTFPFLVQEPTSFVRLMNERKPRVKTVVLTPGQEYVLED
jgi:L-ascorbate metabolism protein UlaG (beta-lactamase superfamily)